MIKDYALCLKTGDTSPCLEVELVFGDKTKTLTGATVVVDAKARYEAGKRIEARPCTIVDAEARIVSFDWLPEDTRDPTPELACQFTVTNSDGSQDTCPGDGYVKVKIEKRI